MTDGASHTITRVDIDDVRVPTSDSLLGSDPFHRKPDYSAAIIRIRTQLGATGWAPIFALGAGTDWLAHGVRDLGQILVGQPFADFRADPGGWHRCLIDHHQLRWLSDGVFRMAVGGLMNAAWDLWAKIDDKPMWRLWCDLDPETVIALIDWRHLRDALDPDEALDLLREARPARARRLEGLRARGPRAYSTSGWLGLGDARILAHIDALKARGFAHFKAKVGAGEAEDRSRLALLREAVGPAGHLMTDANQVWSVTEAIGRMRALAEFRPVWIEEPTARDDVLGMLAIRRALEDVGIGVAAGEAAASPVIFKQLLQSGALTHCQVDATRLGGPSDVFAVLLMAAKFGVPVCPHGGGIGLCNMIRHYAAFDQIAVAGPRPDQIVEYLDFLQDGVFTRPITVEAGHYVLPQAPGWGVDMHEDFIDRHRWPDGPIWRERPHPKGAAFLA